MTILFFQSTRNNQPGRGCLDLTPCQVSLNSVRWLLRRSENVSGQSEAKAAIFFSDRPQNTNMEEDVEIFLPVKFRWILFSGFRREVENASANQRPGRPSSISDQKTQNLVDDVEILLPVNFCWISLVGFRGEIENVSTNSEARAAILFFGSARKYKLGRARLDLASCQVSWNSVQMKSRKCISQSEATAAILFFRSARKT